MVLLSWPPRFFFGPSGDVRFSSLSSSLSLSRLAVASTRRSNSISCYCCVSSNVNIINQEENMKKKKKKKKKAAGAAPWLMLSSLKHPEFRYFYDLLQVENNDDEDVKIEEKIKLNRKIHLPHIAGHHCIGSSQGFLITIDFSKSTEIHLANPITGKHLTLPPISSFPLPTFRYSFTNSQFHARLLNPQQSSSSSDVLLDTRFELLYQSKAILSPSLDIILLLRKRQLPLIAHLGDTSWSNHLPFQYPMCDAIFHKGLLYAISPGGSLAIYDLLANPLSPTKTLFLHTYSDKEELLYLVESPDGNDLFLVRRNLCPWLQLGGHPDPAVTQFMEVFKIQVEVVDEQQVYKLSEFEVERISDAALFIGSNHSISISAHDFPNLKPNTVYFTDRPHKRNLLNLEWVGDTGYCNLEDGQSWESYDFTDSISDLNWPLPIWYTPTSMC